MPDLITSRSNPLIQRVRRLGERKHRRREGVFVVAGGQPVWRAVESGWPVETLIVCDDLVTHEPTRDMVRTLEATRRTRVAHVSSAVFDAVTDREGITGVAAVVEQRVSSLGGVPVAADTLIVVLHHTGNPGNLGTIIRTADAVGAAAVVLVGDTTDPWSPAAVKASMGSVFAVPIVPVHDIDEVLSFARDAGVTLWATSGYAARAVWDVPVTGPIGVLLGSEGDGLPAEIVAAADERVQIPMVGTAESLNLAVAAGVVLYDIRRRTPGWPAS